MKNTTYLLISVTLLLLIFTGCSDDDVPEVENEEEIITDVTLTFTPAGDGDVVTASAEDPDGEGPEDIEVTSNIALEPNTTYVLSLSLENAIAGESITEEVEEEADEHMFFFAWTDGLFSNPEGDGNIDSREGEVLYEDFDDANLPLGLETTWTTGEAATGVFRIVLKHQPDLKSATSTVNDGSTDLDLEWQVTIQ